MGHPAQQVISSEDKRSGEDQAQPCYGEVVRAKHPASEKQSDAERPPFAAYRENHQAQRHAEQVDTEAHRSALHRRDSAKSRATPFFKLFGVVEQFAALAAKLSDVSKPVVLGHEVKPYIADTIHAGIMLLHKRKMRKRRLPGIGGMPQERSEDLAKLEMKSQFLNFFCKGGLPHNLGCQFKRIYERIGIVFSEDLAASLFEDFKVSSVLSAPHGYPLLGSSDTKRMLIKMDHTPLGNEREPCLQVLVTCSV